MNLKFSSFCLAGKTLVLAWIAFFKSCTVFVNGMFSMGYSLAAHLITILKVSPSDIVFHFNQTLPKILRNILSLFSAFVLILGTERLWWFSHNLSSCDEIANSHHITHRVCMYYGVSKRKCKFYGLFCTCFNTI